MNQKFLDKLQNLIAILLVAAIFSGGIYFWVLKPKIKEINTLKNSLKMIDNEIKSLEGGEVLFNDINAARAVIKKELTDISMKVPSEAETPYLVNNFISVVGKGLNIDYNLIQPGAVMPEQQYKRFPLHVEFEGDYSNLNMYLTQLKNLPVTIRVDNMTIQRVIQTKKLSIKMTLSAFVMPGGIERHDLTIKGKTYFYDPFFAHAAPQGEKKLEAIAGLKYTGYWMGKEMQAIINDEPVKAGDTISGFKVVRIYKDRVALMKNGKLYELHLVQNK